MTPWVPGEPSWNASVRDATKPWSERLRAGLARREEVEDLALRVAQLEHRLRLLERDRVA